MLDRNREKDAYLREVGGCYLYLFSVAVLTAFRSVYPSVKTPDLLLFKDEIPGSFRASCKSIRARVVEFDQYRGLLSQEPYMERFLALIKYIVETKKGFSQLTAVVKEDLTHALHKGLGFSKIDWDISTPLNEIRHYLGIIAGYGPNTKNPHILKDNGTDRVKPIAHRTETVDRLNCPWESPMLSLREEWHAEKRNLNRQAEPIVTAVADKVSSYVTASIDFPAMRERGHGIALTSCAGDFIDQYVAALKWSLVHDGIVHFSSDPQSATKDKNFIYSRELEEMLHG